MKIYTITLNPAYDVHAFAEHFSPFHENLADVTSREAGGKGVNLSRALQNAVTYGTAACLSAGSLPPTKEDIAAAYPKVQVKKFS